MKPRLRSDAYFLPTSRGALVGLAARPGGELLLPGAGTYAWLDRLAPLLTGEHELRALLARLDQRRRETVERLLERLAGGGFVKDATGERPHTLAPGITSRYAHVITHLAALDSPEQRFQTYRETRPTIVGSGALIAPLVAALFHTGVARVRLVLTRESQADVERLQQLLSEALARDPEHALELVRADAAADGLAAAGTPLLQVLDVAGAERSAALRALCAQSGSVFAGVGVHGSRATVESVAARGAPSAVDVSHALLDHVLQDRALQDRALRERGPVEAGASAASFRGPVAAIVAQHLCVGYLEAVCGCTEPGEVRFVEIDLETLQLTRRGADGNARQGASW